MGQLDVNTPQDNILYLSTALAVFDGSGSPEGIENGALGSLYCDKATGNWYQKTTALGTLTGWTLFSGGGGGTPGGSDTQVQFNDAGSFGGDDDFTWNKITKLLMLGAGSAGGSIGWTAANGFITLITGPAVPTESESYALPITPPTITGEFLFVSSKGLNTQFGFSSNLTYDPVGRLSIDVTQNQSAYATVNNASSGNAAQSRLAVTANVSGGAIAAYSSGFTTSGLRVANSVVLDLDGPNAVILGQTAGVIQFGLGTTEYARLTSTVLTLFGSASGSVTGLSVTSGSAGNAVTIASLSSGTSEEIFIIPKGNAALKVGTGGGAGSTDQGLYLSRLLNNSNGSGNGHAFVDASTFARTTGGPNGYASFDTPVIIGSAAAYDHYVSYQARPTTAASSTWSDIFGAYFTATFGASSTTTRNTGVWIAPPVMGAGAAITNNIGIWVDGTTAPGSFNYSLVSTGVSYFLTHAGAVALGTTTNPSTALHITGNATRESLLRFTPNANASFVGCEWTDNSNLGVTSSLKYKANTGEFQLLASTSAFLTFLTNAAEVLRLDVSGNLLLGATAAGISASKVFAHKLGVAPTTQPADLVQEYVLDAVAGKSEKYITDEAGYTARLTGCLKILNQDFSTTTTTLANVVGSVAKYDLAHDVEAGRRYRFKIWFTTDNEFGSGVKVNIAGSATMTHSRASYKITQLAATGLGIVDQYAEESTFSTTVSKATTTGLNFIVEIEGSFIVNAAGTVLLQFAEETATGTGKIRQGAYFELSMSE